MIEKKTGPEPGATPMTSDSALLLALARGDDSAARDLYARIGPRLSAYTRALLRDDAAADDVVQQTWLRAMTRPRSELAQVRDAAAWLISIARTTALNHTRHRSRAMARDRWRGGASSSAHAAANHADLHAAIDALSDDHRELLLLKHVAGLTFDQMAATLGENRSTIASRHRTALETLRSHMHSSTEVRYA